MEIVVKQNLFFQARKITSVDFHNSIGYIVPLTRHKLVFKHPTGLSKNGPHPNHILRTRTAVHFEKMMNETQQHQTGPWSPAVKRQKQVAKIRMISDMEAINQVIADQAPTGNTNQPCSSPIATQTIHDKAPQENTSSNDMLEMIKGMFNTFTTNINGTLQEWQTLRQSDQTAMQSMSKQIQTMEDGIKHTNENMKNMEINMTTIVDTTVRAEIDSHMRAFDRRLTNQVKTAIDQINDHNHQQLLDLKVEQQEFMKETREIQAENKQFFSAIMSKVCGTTTLPFSTVTNTQSTGTQSVSNNKHRTPNTRSSTKSPMNNITDTRTTSTINNGHLRDENMSSCNSEYE
jgi:anion-transporting  ArsA/GET3 family ATPase